MALNDYFLFLLYILIGNFLVDLHQQGIQTLNQNDPVKLRLPGRHCNVGIPVAEVG